MDEYINPKSMITPGVAGAVAAVIAGAAWNQFGVEPKWTTLAVSFLLGAVVIKSFGKVHHFELGVFYVLNSLIIFSTSIGVTTAGVAVTTQKASLGIISPAFAEEPSESEKSKERSFFRPIFETKAKPSASQKVQASKQTTQSLESLFGENSIECTVDGARPFVYLSQNVGSPSGVEATTFGQAFSASSAISHQPVLAIDPVRAFILERPILQFETARACSQFQALLGEDLEHTDPDASTVFATDCAAMHLQEGQGFVIQMETLQTYLSGLDATDMIPVPGTLRADNIANC